MRKECSDRELGIMEGMHSMGATSTEIAEYLDVSERTVYRHKKNEFKKPENTRTGRPKKIDDETGQKIIAAIEENREISSREIQQNAEINTKQVEKSTIRRYIKKYTEFKAV
jgi:transposase